PFPGGRVILLAVLFGVVLCALGGFLAWRSYQSRVEQAESRIATAAAEAARASEQFFSDRIAVLEVVTDMPVFDEPEPADLGPVLQALDGQDLGFDGGVGWADETGELVVSTSIDEVLLPFDLSGREYATVVLESRQPFVGAARQSSSGSTVIPVRSGPEPADLGPMLQALDGQDLGFDGGVGWADETGELVVSTSLDEVLLPFDLSGRDYATVVLESRLPFVGAARQSSSGSTVIPVAVPTFADNGELTGMLVAGIRSETL